MISNPSAVNDLVRLLRVLSEPDGAKKIVADLEAATAAADEARGELVKEQQAHAAREKTVKDAEAGAAKKAKDLADREVALAAAMAAHGGKQAALDRDRATVAAVGAALSDREKAIADAEKQLKAREAELARQQRIVERRTAEADEAIARAKTVEDAAHQFAEAETARLRERAAQISAAARAVAEA